MIGLANGLLAISLTIMNQSEVMFEGSSAQKVTQTGVDYLTPAGLK